MFSFTDIFFYLYFLLFIVSAFISFYIPGSLVLSKFKIESRILKFVLANALGVSLWGFQGYVFGYLNLRFITYIYCLISIIYFVYNLKYYKQEVVSLKQNFNRKNLLPILIILVGCIFQLVPIFGSGMKYHDGIKFLGNNANDGIMHLAYIESIKNYFPPQEPGFAGVAIHNYHYWADLVEADLSRIWTIPVIHLFFQYIPIYLSTLIGLSALLLIYEWGGNKKMGLWFVFLLYFASDAAYLVLLIIHKQIGFYTPAIDSGILQFLNMPHMFGKFIFLSGLIAFQRWIKTKDLSWGVVMAILFASLFGFKIYYGLFIGIGLAFYFIGNVVYESANTKKILFDYKSFILLASLLIVSIAIFLPHNLGAGGFIYVYLEWPRSLLGTGSIDWREWWLRRQVYEAAHNIRNLIFMDVLAIAIAFISIYGTRLFGFFITKRLIKFLGFEKILFLIPPLIIFHLLGLFTIQKSGGVNVYNFFSVSAIILSLFSAYLLSKIKNNLLGLIFIIFFIAFTIPRSVFEIWYNTTHYNSSDFRIVTNDELDAFKFIRQNSNRGDLVQSSPDNAWDKETPYVPFFTDRRSFLSGSGLLTTHNIKIDERRKAIDDAFRSVDLIDFRTKLKRLGVKYVYIQKKPEQTIKYQLDPTYIKKVFENKTTFVLQVQ